MEDSSTVTEEGFTKNSFSCGKGHSNRLCSNVYYVDLWLLSCPSPPFSEQKLSQKSTLPYLTLIT